VGLKEESAELEWADKSALSGRIFPLPTNMSLYGGLGYLPHFLRREQGLPGNALQSIK